MKNIAETVGRAAVRSRQINGVEGGALPGANPKVIAETVASCRPATAPR
jgi:hypothetical protein